MIFGRIPFAPTVYTGANWLQGGSFVYGQQPLTAYSGLPLTYTAGAVAPWAYTAGAPLVYAAGVAPKTFAQVTEDAATHVTYA